MSVQTDCSVFFDFVVEVLADLYEAAIVVMRSFRKQISDSAVGFAHQIVDDQQRCLPSSKSPSGKPLMNSTQSANSSNK